MITLLLIMDEHLALQPAAPLLSLALLECLPLPLALASSSNPLAPCSLSLADDDDAISGIAHDAADGLQLYGGLAPSLALCILISWSSGGPSCLCMCFHWVLLLRVIICLARLVSWLPS